MRHRMASGTGLGNPSGEILNNSGTINKEMATEVIDLFFSKWGGIDYQIDDDGIKIGIEPTYQYEELKIIYIAKNKGNSYIQYGKAWGSYGSEIASTTRYYSDYKNKSKFIKFVDKWHKLALLNKEDKNKL